MEGLSYLSTPNPKPLQYKSIVDIVNERANETPDQEIIIERFQGGFRKALTYRQLQTKSIKLAKYLVANGIGAGDSVAIVGPNSLEWIIGELAIFMTGGVAVHMQRTTEGFSEMLRFLKSTDCKAVLADPGEDEKYLAEMETYIVSPKTLELNKENLVIVLMKKPRTSELPSFDVILSDNDDKEHFNTPLPKINPESPAIIFATSGSTGAPKMAEYTHFAVVNASFASFAAAGADQQGKFYNDRPFTWLGGTPIYSIIMGNPRVFADTRLSLEKGNMVEIWDIILKEKCKNAVFLPYALTDLMQNKVEITKHGYKLYGILTAGQIIGSHFTEVIGTFCEKMFSAYASTEMGGISYTELMPSMEVGNVGKLFPGYEVKIVGNTDVTLDRGDMGEILVRSPFSMKGYRNAPELNIASFADGGWFRTGDMGIIAKDGTLCVKGKATDVIKRGGMKILSSEVESIIKGIKGVKDGVVVAVPNVHLLEEVCACFVLESGTNTEETDIRKICKEKLGDNILGSSPTFYLNFEDFPLLANGKIDKVLIKQLAMDKLNLG